MSLINSKEAAERLGTTTFTVRSLIGKKLLKDYKRHNPHHARHNPLLDKREVNALKEVYDPNVRITDKRAAQLRAALKADKKYKPTVEHHSNGNAPSKPTELVGAFSRWKRIEEKVDTLESKIAEIEKSINTANERLDIIIKLWS